MLSSLFFVTLILAPKFGYVDFSVIIPLVILSLKLCLSDKSIVLSRSVIGFLTLLFFIVFLTYFAFLLSGSMSIQYALKPLKLILIIMIAGSYLSISGLHFIDVLKMIVWVCLLNTLVVYLQYILDMYGIIKDFMYHHSIGTYTPYRKPGLATGFPMAGILSFLGSYIALYLAYYSKSYFWFFVSSFCALSVFLTARSTMYVFLLCYPVLMIVFMLRFRIFKYFIVSSFLLTCIVIFLLSTDNLFISGTLNKMFANVINYYNTGSFHDYSTRHMLSDDHVFLPDGAMSFLFGDNDYIEQKGFASDLSFIEMIWSVGFLTLVFYIIANIYLYAISFKAIYINKLKGANILYAACFFSVFIMYFKGPYLFSSIVAPLLILLAFSTINSHGESRKY